jgi:hypothetical protein
MREWPRVGERDDEREEEVGGRGERGGEMA